MTGTTGTAPPPDGGARDYPGRVRWQFRPRMNGTPDPGEIVWTWVAYEDDPSVGKDRPVVVIGLAERKRLAVLMLSTRDHTGDSRWLPIGSGAWDFEHRPSWVRGDRVLAVDPGAVRREGAMLPQSVFEAIQAHSGRRPSRLRQGIARLVRGPARRPLTPLSPP